MKYFLKTFSFEIFVDRIKMLTTESVVQTSDLLITNQACGVIQIHINTKVFDYPINSDYRQQISDYKYMPETAVYRRETRAPYISECPACRMSSYKVLPPYCDLGGPDYYSPLLMDQDITYTASTDDFSQVPHLASLEKQPFVFLTGCCLSHGSFLGLLNSKSYNNVKTAPMLSMLRSQGNRGFYAIDQLCN